MSNFIKTFITAKIDSPMNLCDDHFAYNLDKLNFAISDGASCNLASRIYSRLLVDYFTEYDQYMFSDEMCDKMCETWMTETDKMINDHGNPYYLRNKFIKREEAAATFVGMKMYKNEENEWLWDSYVLGDSVLIFIPDGESCPSILYTTNKSDFTPDFSTNIIFNNNPKSAHPYNSQLWRNQVWEEKGNKLNKGTFVFMTDALAEWFLFPNYKSVEDKLLMLMNIESDKDFLEFVDRERSICLDGNLHPLHDDDITLMILHIDDIPTLSKQNNIVEKTKSNYRLIIEIEEARKSIKTLKEQCRLQVENKKNLEDKNEKLKEEISELKKEISELKKNEQSEKKHQEPINKYDIKVESHNGNCENCKAASKEDLNSLNSHQEEVSRDIINTLTCESQKSEETIIGTINSGVEEIKTSIEKGKISIEEDKNEIKKKIEVNDTNQKNIKEELENLKKKIESLMNIYHQFRIMTLVFGVICFSTFAIVISLLIMVIQLFC